MDRETKSSLLMLDLKADKFRIQGMRLKTVCSIVERFVELKMICEQEFVD